MTDFIPMDPNGLYVALENFSNMPLAPDACRLILENQNRVAQASNDVQTLFFLVAMICVACLVLLAIVLWKESKALEIILKR